MESVPAAFGRSTLLPIAVGGLISNLIQMIYSLSNLLKIRIGIRRKLTFRI